MDSEEGSGLTRCGPYIVGKVLGRGASAVVRLGKHEGSGELVALKMVSREDADRNEDLRKRVMREAAVMRLFDHPNVLKLYDFIQTDDLYVLVLEYMNSGDLFDLVVKEGCLDEKRARAYFRQLITGVQHCHDRHVFHCDLKLENLLLDANNRLVVADFDLASMMRPDSLYHMSRGSPNYVSPEVLTGQAYGGKPVDIWSCGVILYVLVTGSLPFDDDSVANILRKVQRGKIFIPSYLSDQCAGLIRRMVVVRPEGRIPLAKVREHCWFTFGYHNWFGESEADMKKENEVVAGKIDEPIFEVVQWLSDMGCGETEAIVEELQRVEQKTVRELYFILCLYRCKRGKKRGKNPLEELIDSFMNLITGKFLQEDPSPFESCPPLAEQGTAVSYAR